MSDSPEDPGARMARVNAEIVRQNRMLPNVDSDGQPIRTNDDYTQRIDRLTGRQLTHEDVADLYLAGREDLIGQAFAEGRLAEVMAVEPGLGDLPYD